MKDDFINLFYFLKNNPIPFEQEDSFLKRQLSQAKFLLLLVMIFSFLISASFSLVGYFQEDPLNTYRLLFLIVTATLLYSLTTHRSNTFYIFMCFLITSCTFYFFIYFLYLQDSRFFLICAFSIIISVLALQLTLLYSMIAFISVNLTILTLFISDFSLDALEIQTFTTILLFSIFASVLTFVIDRTNRRFFLNELSMGDNQKRSLSTQLQYNKLKHEFNEHITKNNLFFRHYLGMLHCDKNFIVEPHKLKLFESAFNSNWVLNDLDFSDNKIDRQKVSLISFLKCVKNYGEDITTNFKGNIILKEASNFNYGIEIDTFKFNILLRNYIIGHFCVNPSSELEFSTIESEGRLALKINKKSADTLLNFTTSNRTNTSTEDVLLGVINDTLNPLCASLGVSISHHNEAGCTFTLLQLPSYYYITSKKPLKQEPLLSDIKVLVLDDFLCDAATLSKQIKKHTSLFTIQDKSRFDLLSVNSGRYDIVFINSFSATEDLSLIEDIIEHNEHLYIYTENVNSSNLAKLKSTGAVTLEKPLYESTILQCLRDCAITKAGLNSEGFLKLKFKQRSHDLLKELHLAYIDRNKGAILQSVADIEFFSHPLFLEDINKITTEIKVNADADLIKVSRGIDELSSAFKKIQ